MKYSRARRCRRGNSQIGTRQMPSATISGSKTSDIGTLHDGKIIRSSAYAPLQQESPAPHACDAYATTAQNTPAQVDDRQCGHHCGAPVPRCCNRCRELEIGGTSKRPSGELGQCGCAVDRVGKRGAYWAFSASPLRLYGAARP